MRAGTLNRMLKQWRKVEIGRDPFSNTPIYQDQAINSFWAALVPKSEEERFAASQIYASQVVVFRTFYIDDIRETDEIEYEGAHYNIAGIREIGYRAGTEITAKRIVTTDD